MKYTKWMFLVIIYLVLTDCILAQYSPYTNYIPTISADRRVDWRTVGLHNQIPSIYNRVFNVRDYGAVPNDGLDDRQAIQNTIEAARIYIDANTGFNAVVYLPQGLYKLNSGLNLVNASASNYSEIIIKGDGSDKTTLFFPNSYKGKAIQIRAEQYSVFQEIYAGYFRDDQIIYTNTNGYNVGDYIEIIDDFPLEFGQIGQIEKVINKTGTQLILENKLAISYDYGSTHPQIRKLAPIKNVGVEDLLIQRENTTGLWENTIDYQYAADCWILGVESYIAYKHHIGINASTAIEIRGCYFHHVSGHGEGGIGYGVLLENHSTNCLIEDNQFDALRHSMIVQSGANRNVFGYNYSWNREWETWTAFPGIGTGDISVHGNYPYANLFEGNKVELIWADDAHSVMNGPYNTFFRNDVTSHVIYLNQAHYSNAIGNYVYEVDTDGGPIYPPFGNGIGSTNVLDNAAKQFNQNGTIYNYSHAKYFALGFLGQANSLCMDFSYYYDDIPAFIEQYDPYVVSWPCLGTTCYVDGTGQNVYWPRATIPAVQRKLAGGKITLSGNSVVTNQLTATMTGPSYLASGQVGTFIVSASGGTPPYSYAWSYYTYCSEPLIASVPESKAVIVPNSVPCGYWFNISNTTNTITRAGDGNGRSFQVKCIVTDASNNTVTLTHDVSCSISHPPLPKQQAVNNDAVLSEMKTELLDNYPNPFNPSTIISYSIKTEGRVSLKIYNTLGQEIRTLVDEIKQAGNSEVEFNASELPSGIYIYRMQSGDYLSIKKMLLVK